MSSNAQYHVTPKKHISASEYFSLASTLGARGVSIMGQTLQKLSDQQFPDEICDRLPWRVVEGKSETFRQRIGSYDVTLSLRNSTPALTVSGMQTGSAIPSEVMALARAAVAETLALTVTERLASRLGAFASEHTSEAIQETVMTRVALKALQLQKRKVAIRATCQLSYSHF